MPKFYNPFDWYWLREDGVIYSSNSQSYVSENDTIYASWCESGGSATLWPRDEKGIQTDAALQDVLTPYGLKLPPQEASS